YCRHPRKIASDATCSQSIRFSIARFGSSTLPRIGRVMAMKAPGMMLMKNNQCHESELVIHPPTVGPNVGASVETTPRIAGIIARCLREKSEKRVANTVGTIAPPTNPWIAGNTVIELIDHAMPHISDDSVNSTADAVNNHRVESACERNAASGIITI